jgi:CO/xanthine dehydrogenase Mo-binding subunit
VKGGGAMIVGFSAVGAGLGAKVAQAADDPYASNAPFDQAAVDSYLVIHADNTASVMSGYAEAGTGTSTGFLMIAAEELDMDVSQLRSIDPDTNLTPYTGVSSSQGIRTAGPKVRAAAAYAKQALLGLASTQLGAPASSLTVSKGVVSGGGRSVTYGELLGGKLFNVKMSSPTLQAGQAPAKPVSQYKLIGTTVPRIDVPTKVTGAFTYAQFISLPGMLHGRVVRPRGQWVFGVVPQVLSVDESSIKNIPNVQLVRKNDFIGVVAPEEYDAIQAAAQLKVKWADPPAALPSTGSQYKRLRDLDSANKDATQEYIQDTGVPDVDVALKGAAKVLSQTYLYPYQGHDPIGPYCAVADVTANGARVWNYSQSLFGDRTKVAQALGIPEARVHLIFAGGASGFSAPFHEPAVAAALMSQAVGKPVRAQWMRWDDHGWDVFGQAMIVDVTAGIDANGNMVGFNSTAFQQQFADVNPSLEAAGIDRDYAAHVQTRYEGLMGPASDGSGNRGVDGKYGVNPGSPGVPTRILVKTMPAIGNGLRVGFVEGPGHPQTIFAWEQMVDELAHAANMDPLLFRLQNIRRMPWAQTTPKSATITINGQNIETKVALAGQTTEDRLRAILNKVAEISKWKPKVAASSLSDARVVSGRGVTWSSHAPDAFGAVVADIEVDKKTGKIVVTHMYGVQDSGLAINPGELQDLMVGGMIHGASRALYEEARYNKTNVTSLDWVSYPILRFKDSPKVTTALLSNPALLPKGAGEEVHDNIPSVIANAFFDATGVRMREVPLSPARVRATLKAAGVS